MPVLRPFSGLRYSTSPHIADLVCPPYDVITPEEQQRLTELNPHNAVRLELNSGSGPERYEQAALTLENWIESGVLVGEATPALYVYRQDFMQGAVRRSVTGVIGALELEPFGTKGVLPHEQTMPGPKSDRLALLRACPVNISPIYAIYRGGGSISGFLSSVPARPVAARVVDPAGTLHRLWVITAPAEIELLSGAVEKGPLVIADGHHRYETALDFQRERTGTEGEHDAIMCLVVDADSEQPAVLPYHRAVTVGSSPEHIEQELARWPEGDEAGGHHFTFLLPGKDVRITVPGKDVAAALSGHSPDWAALDVVVLHEIVFPALLEGSMADIMFSKDESVIREAVEGGESDFGVLVKGVTGREIVSVAGSGERMPQKASYFWPKAITGLVFRPLVSRESLPA